VSFCLYDDNVRAPRFMRLSAATCTERMAGLAGVVMDRLKCTGPPCGNCVNVARNGCTWNGALRARLESSRGGCGVHAKYTALANLVPEIAIIWKTPVIESGRRLAL